MAILAVLALIALLVARADARPLRDDDDETFDDASERDAVLDDTALGDGARDELTVRPGARLFIPVSPAMVERIVTFAPPVAAVVEAAYRAAGLAGDPSTSWRRRSRIAALLPGVSARVGQNQAWRDVTDPTISHALAFSVGASWRIDRLLFDPNEPRFEAAKLARRRERRRLAAETIHLYFDWATARAAASHDARAVLDAQERAAELDALTDGWFSEALAKRAELR
ncbi:MAG TPA: hypothetical protein VFS15_21020 [Kofleriaceae bacterium]|nr:hypothetical protein [Kofleriaceae bacterium]